MEELENIKKQFDELMERAEKIVKKNGDEEPKRWRAEEGGRYYYIGEDLEPHIDYDDYTQVDDLFFTEIGNYFQTEKEAEKVAQHIKDYLILRADAKGFEPKDLSCYCIYAGWDCELSELDVVYGRAYRSGTIYFETEEDARASIEKHGDIWKRYLGVEE